MLLYKNGMQFEQLPDSPPHGRDAVCIAPGKERGRAFAALGLKEPRLYSGSNRAGTYYERHGSMDCFLLHIPGGEEDVRHQVEIFFADNRLLLLGLPRPLQSALTQWIAATPEEAKYAAKTLGAFFSLLLSEGMKKLEALESSIAALEDNLEEDSDTSEDYPTRIRTLRKTLLLQKRYYEALLSLFEELEEGKRGSLEDAQQAFLQYLGRRADRVYRMVLSLREYLSHVSEAYQSQTDIELNRVMKFFTVITAIFLPLTLIVGWYGMNLSMPEYRFAYAYPVVIAVSLAIVVGSILYFKKKKWF